MLKPRARLGSISHSSAANEVFWKCRWENSIAGASTPYRTFVCYKETWNNQKLDPSGEWTGTWRDPRFSPPYDGKNPENALTGTIYYVDAFRNDPMTISSAEGKLRFWRNTGIDTLPDGQTATLPAGVLGFEWDETPDNGFQPPGQIRMSTTTIGVKGYSILYGQTTAPGCTPRIILVFIAIAVERSFLAQELPNGRGDWTRLTTFPGPRLIRE